MIAAAELLESSPYEAYLYSYPHKTAYRPIDPARSLAELWQKERRDALSLYIHVPYCETRCGYCNLFSRPQPTANELHGYIAALERHSGAVKDAISPARFARFAIGGGTPTVLSRAQLEQLLVIAEKMMGVAVARIPTSVEISPATTSIDKLRVLSEHGVCRISIGIQTFVGTEARALCRQQTEAEVQRSLTWIRDLRFPVLNIDLIYGIEGQTEQSWLTTLRAALSYRPEELYLYPLYIRPLTALGRSELTWADHRLRLYRIGRDLLMSSGYRQISMRMFRASHAPEVQGSIYRCQEDGMVGLGCGARSYTDQFHYSLDYAVHARNVHAILSAYTRRSMDDFRVADYGFLLDEEERQRRYVILSLLSHEGLALGDYRRRFASDACHDLPELDVLEQAGLARRENGRMLLTPIGVERSDLIGPKLLSERVARLMREYKLK